MTVRHLKDASNQMCHWDAFSCLVDDGSHHHHHHGFQMCSAADTPKQVVIAMATNCLQEERMWDCCVNSLTGLKKTCSCELSNADLFIEQTGKQHCHQPWTYHSSAAVT